LQAKFRLLSAEGKCALGDDSEMIAQELSALGHKLDDLSINVLPLSSR